MNVQTIVDANFPQPQVASPPTIVMNGVRWESFKALMADVGDGRAWRIAYDKGVLEIRMPYQEHEQPKILLGYLVTAIADELEIEIMELDALLLEREDLTRAVKSDNCFYIQNESIVRGKKSIELPNEPPF